MTNFRAVVGVVLLLSFNACSLEGKDCTGRNPNVCASGSAAFFCESPSTSAPVREGEVEKAGVFVRYECPGPLGCGILDGGSSSYFACDARGAAAGDLCPSAYENAIVCGRQQTALRCTQRHFVVCDECNSIDVCSRP